jgi:hypothetical protein
MLPVWESLKVSALEGALNKTGVNKSRTTSLIDFRTEELRKDFMLPALVERMTLIPSDCKQHVAEVGRGEMLQLTDYTRNKEDSILMVGIPEERIIRRFR